MDRGQRTNAVGTANVVRAAQAAGVSRLVYFQTALCYGLHPQEQPITLSHPLDPKDSSYAISKTAGEWYVRLSGLDWISFRLANVYGPRNLSGPLPTFFQRLTEGKPCFVMDTRRDFVFVEDLVEVAMKAVDGGGESGVYHVSSGLRRLDQGALRRDGQGNGRRARGGGRGPAAESGRCAVDPARPVEDGDAISTGRRGRRSKTASRRRSTTTASTASSETYTHLKGVDASNPTGR